MATEVAEANTIGIGAEIRKIKERRRALERELMTISHERDEGAKTEGLVKKLLGQFYRPPPAPPHTLARSREEIGTELPSLNEALLRLRDLHAQAISREKEETIARLMQAYRKELRLLLYTVMAATAANDRLWGLELKMGQRYAYSLRHALQLQAGYVLTDWKAGVENFLDQDN